MPLINRISKFLDEKGLTQSQFCKKTGFSKQNLSKFLTGSVKHVKIDLAMVIAKHFPEVNLKWLLTGEGQMFNNSRENLSKLEKENIELIKEISELSKENSELKSQIISLLMQKNQTPELVP